VTDNSDQKTEVRHPKRRCVLVFVKAPEAGMVKTRLARRITDARALELYRCFTADILDTLRLGGHFIKICYYPKEARESVRHWLGSAYAYQEQNGSDLGEKMADAFARTFSRGWDKAILIGTDFPDLPGSIIEEALNRLDHRGAVIGPAQDGGYYLIGFRASAYLPEIFENISWSRPDVFRKTLDILERKAIGVHILPQWRDIDEYSDLEHFMRSHKRDASTAKNTTNYLTSIGWMCGGGDNHGI